MKIIRADQRHIEDQGWLKARWLFSFDSYFDPDNIQLGALRVFNDDRVEPGSGFDTHSHRQMEIVSIILEGEITHQDSMGNKTVLKRGDIQRMSAGTGITHSEHNLGDDPLNLYQIWLRPRTADAIPSYEQANLSEIIRPNELVPVVSGIVEDAPLSMDADGTIYMADLEAGTEISYELGADRHGLVYITEGEIMLNGESLNAKDQARLSGPTMLAFNATKPTKLVLIEVGKVTTV